SIEEGIGLKKAEEVIGKPIFWQVPHDPKPVIAARVAGQPLVKHAPKSRVQQSIVGLAQALYGKPVQAPDSRGSRRGWGFFGKRGTGGPPLAAGHRRAERRPRPRPAATRRGARPTGSRSDTIDGHRGPTDVAVTAGHLEAQQPQR